MNAGRHHTPTVGAFGMLTWDQILRVDTFPEAGSFTMVQDTLEQSGGTTGNMSAALARLGVDVSLTSCVGDDDAGQALLNDLQAEGCNVEHVAVLANTPTDRGVIISSGNGDSGDRTILWLKGARLKHGHHLPVEEYFAKDLVLVDVDDPRLRLFLLDLPMHVSPRTRIFGTLTFLAELESWHALELALRHDYLSGNVAELIHATGCATLPDAIDRFQREIVLSQVRFAAVSDGPNGCHIVTREDVLHVPAFEIDAYDPTGAGDAFAAGIAYAVINRWDLSDTGRFANAMGALATRSLGARASLPRIDDVYSFLNSARIRPVNEHHVSPDRTRTY